MYTQVPSHAQPLVNAFSFDVAKCGSYQLGSADIRVNEPSVGGEGPSGGGVAEAGIGAKAAGGGAGERVAGELQARIEALEAEMLKMQGMILLHDGQLQQLPGYPTAAP